MDITKFNEKLNLVDGNIYTIEERVTLTDGVYEGILEHDNVEKDTINVYTGSKLTGEKINAFTLSTPSLTPWKTNIKIYSDKSMLYITYETTGDTVEAEDVNKLQDTLNETQTALNSETDRATRKENEINASLSSEVSRAKSAESALTTKINNEISRATNKENSISSNLDAEIKRAKDKESQIDTELSNRYKKTEVYTKEEVLQEIQNLIGSAPEVLDTFGEIAEALGNDANFATTMTTMLSQKVDKVSGKALSTNDFDNTQKSNLADAYNKRHTHDNKSVLDGITSALVNTWNNAYSHVSDTVKHITSSERTLWNTVSNKLDKTANAVSASKLATVRNIALTGAVTGNVNFDGSGNVSISTNRRVYDALLAFNNTTYMKIMTITVTGAYVNAPITFDVIGRSTSSKKTSFAVKFSNVATNSPEVESFTYTGDSIYGSTAKIYKVSGTGNTYDIWLKQAQGYDGITISALTLNSGSLSISYPGTTATALPTGMASDRTATLGTITANINGNATTADSAGTASSCTGNSATATKLQTARNIALTGAITGSINFDGNENVSMTTKEGDISFKQLGGVGAKTDWNTLTTAGCYKVQMPKWGDADTYHSPNSYSNVYQYGLLLVFKSSVELENRTVQIYMPHKDGNAVEGIILTRMLNGTGWKSWSPLFKGIGKSDVGLGNVNNTSDLNKPISTATQTALDGKSNTNHTHDLSDMINTLSTGSSTPTDTDYFVSQYVGGVKTTYHRRPVSSLWNYMNNKASAVYAKISHAHNYTDITNPPTKLSQFTNDTGYITQADIDTNQNHIHANKAVLDSITSANINDWNGGVRRIAFIGSDVASSNGWYKVASQTCSGRENQNITFQVTSTYGRYNFGQLQLQIRSDNTSIICKRLSWATRTGLDAKHYVVVVDGMTWTLYAYQPHSQYSRLCFEILSSSSLNSKNDAWPLTFEDNEIKETTAPTATVISLDEATVAYANSAESATKATQDSDGKQINTTYVKKGMTWNELEGL